MLVGVERQPVVDLREDTVLLAQRELELLAEDLRVEQVLHPEADAQRLVGIGGPDPALRRPQLVLTEVPLGDAVELLVIRHDQVRVAGQPQPRRVDTFGLEHVELGQEHRGVDHHTVSDDRRDVVVEHTAGHELEGEHLAVDDDRVPGVVAALVPDDQLALLREVVGEATFPLVAPLGADDHGSGHGSTLRLERGGAAGTAADARDDGHVGRSVVGGRKTRARDPAATFSTDRPRA